MTTSRAPAKRLPSRKQSRWPLLAWALLGCASFAAHAQTVPAQIDAQSLIGNGAVIGATGVIAINEASGLDNVQANQGVLTNGKVPLNLIGSSQSASTNARTTAARSTIGSNAFSNTSGLIEVNQSAGVGNLQRNSAVIGTGPIEGEIVADGVLSATTAKGGGLGRSGENHDAREVSIGADALKNVSGIVQINQTAGSGNVSSNSFVLRPPAGTFF
ncbi:MULTISPECIES: hypothetical protein [Paraburkholderia]|jgi:hypothetical protein|uniref:Adhesin n=1 Tax=Paraburkholderia madseniana TaxID=2599607 RepID=A0A6N6WE58_9BURK|nr:MULTISPECIES: hypothetical protein [Paraburkholderia]KAE8758905.1 hypothetical protein FSO04_16015 [Paraburkholderia madseniana]MCX4173257.1 hypothetical protein [Paraburkholderia madseniana]MDQ6461262.1 hypothetical protein [Paraburkholderia madseniana]NPT63528.1 hypothetical protein [Paraburkholderia madseniana]